MIARDVKPGESWAFREHRSVAQVDRDRAIDDARAAEALAARGGHPIRIREVEMAWVCGCDDGDAEHLSTTHVKAARKEHRCTDCARTIRVGESYVADTWLFEGSVDTTKGCADCAAIVDYMRAAVPCFCWMHDSLLDDALECAREYDHESPGLVFGLLRRFVTIARKGGRVPGYAPRYIVRQRAAAADRPSA